MAAINTISNGANMRALYNQFITALADLLGVTDSLQSTHILVPRLEITSATEFIRKGGGSDMEFDDGNVAVQKLSALLGAAVPTTLIGPMINDDDTENYRAGASVVGLMPFIPLAAVTATGLRFTTVAAFGAGAAYKVGIYDDDGVLLAQTASPSTPSINTIYERSFDATVALEAGTLYWAAIITEDNPQFSRGRAVPWFSRVTNAAGSFALPANLFTEFSKTAMTDFALDVDGWLCHVVVSGGLI